MSVAAPVAGACLPPDRLVRTHAEHHDHFGAFFYHAPSKKSFRQHPLDDYYREMVKCLRDEKLSPQVRRLFLTGAPAHFPGRAKPAATT